MTSKEKDNGCRNGEHILMAMLFWGVAVFVVVILGVACDLEPLSSLSLGSLISLSLLLILLGAWFVCSYRIYKKKWGKDKK